MTILSQSGEQVAYWMPIVKISTLTPNCVHTIYVSFHDESGGHSLVLSMFIEDCSPWQEGDLVPSLDDCPECNNGVRSDNIGKCNRCNGTGKILRLLGPVEVMKVHNLFNSGELDGMSRGDFADWHYDAGFPEYILRAKLEVER